jgi:hypothetical protein
LGVAVKEAPELWWRAKDKRYADYDPWAEFEQPTSSHCKIELSSYPVLRHTPKGVWIDIGFGCPQFILGTAAKQYAVPTKELALQDLIARKKRHVWCCAARLKRAEEHLNLARHALAIEQNLSAPMVLP